MNQFRIQLRTEHGTVKTVDLMAQNHEHAKMTAERQYGLLVLSTEFIE